MFNVAETVLNYFLTSGESKDINHFYLKKMRFGKIRTFEKIGLKCWKSVC